MMNNNTVYENRELSWLKFNERVLEEAQCKDVPLLERLTFATIFQTNLDEFFMVRVGSLFDQMIIDRKKRENKTNMTSEEQLDAIFSRVCELEAVKDKAYKDIMQSLKAYGVEQLNFSNITADEEKYLSLYFKHDVKPLLSPLIIDKRHPFPFLQNKDIYIAAHLESKTGIKIGILPVSNIIKRLIFLNKDNLRFMLSEELILHYVADVFENYKVLDKTLIRITRNADINVEEALFDHDIDFRDAMEELIKKRKKLMPVRLQISRNFNAPALKYLCDKLDISEKQIFHSKTPLDLSFGFQFADLLDDEELRYSKLIPQQPSCINNYEPMIPQIKRKDIMLSYPFESINNFIRLLFEAADDDNVLSVKITLYRLARNSRIIEALVRLAERGKSVLVLVELRARFDEENNIGWSKRLQRAGCTVIYGPPNLKVHSKLLLITRKIGDTIEYITQVGTGNYNEKTSTLYTDLSIMTSDIEIGLEANTVFNALALGNLVENTKYLLVAPNCLQNKITAMIDEQIELARQGKPAYIGAKINSLSDKVIIDKLIEASCEGVRVELIVRGLCCLKAGVDGFTENISITSIVGRFLEHSRIYIFGAGSSRKIYISSADYMTRNTVCRVEVALPVRDADIRQRLWDMFCTMQKDNVKARIQTPDGKYIRKQNNLPPLDSQMYFYEQAYKRAEDYNRTHNVQKSSDRIIETPVNRFYEEFLKQ
ncbi:MAG: polyphosphate kinase 1 [Oscillospiraceae bacterium]